VLQSTRLTGFREMNLAMGVVGKKSSIDIIA